MASAARSEMTSHPERCAVLQLTTDMIIREGRKVIAAEVESERSRKAHARRAVARLQTDPLRRAA